MDIKTAELTKELKDLLSQWELLQNDTAATQEQFTTLRTKIEHICDELDKLATGKLS